MKAVVALVFAAGAAWTLYALLFEDIPKTQQLQKEIAAQERENREARRANEKLAREIRAAKTGEKGAKQRLRDFQMIKSGEILILPADPE